jgi:Uma2 family endonuclease
MTTDEFLNWESGDDRRYELINGQVVVMESASAEHQTVVLNIATAFRSHLRGTPCKALPSVDVKCNDHNCLIPDVLVHCEKDRRSRAMEQCPLLVEVLSPSTASFDRNGKFALYRHLTALREYMLVDWSHRTTHVHRRTGSGAWEVARYSGLDVVHLASIDLALPGAVIFEDVGDAA